MLFKIMEKLVRDKIIQKILDNWENPQYRIAKDEEFLWFLFQKLQEETTELIQDKNQEEMADVLAVLYAIMDNFWWNIQDIEQIRLQKKEKNWWFELGHILTLSKK